MECHGEAHVDLDVVVRRRAEEYYPDLLECQESLIELTVRGEKVDQHW